jgi:inactivated superfamily I helicase
MLFNALRSPYFGFDLDPSNIDALEEISRKAKIVGGQKQWQETWEILAPSQSQEIDLDDERRLPGLPRGEEARALQRSLQTCFERLSAPVGTQSQMFWVSWLEDVLERLEFYDRANNERDEMACEILRETLRALVLSESVIGEQSSDYSEFFSSLQNALSGAGLPEPRLKDQPALLVGQMVEARGIRFKAVALLGFAEGMFPQVERPDPFLDELLRQRLGLEPRLNREQAGLFYQAVARADQYLLITRSYLTESGEDWEASPFWKDVQKRFDRTALKVVRPDDISSLNDAASSQELLFWAVRHKNLPTQFLGLAQRWEAIRYGREIPCVVLSKPSAGDARRIFPNHKHPCRTVCTGKGLERFTIGSLWELPSAVLCESSA